MKIELHNITVRDLTENYEDNKEDGVTGLGGMLDIRPPYQREFVYNAKQREAVMETVVQHFPLNIMYWAVNDDGYEIIDGQQRTISICQYVNGDFSVDNKYFHNLTQDEKDNILDYVLTVYVCEGTESEKLDWFRTINIAGEELTEQELRNATYHGPWLSDAKRYFSRTGCAAYGLGSDYVKGSPIRQDYLETVLKWISENNVEDYMAQHQHDVNAAELWQYFQQVINWVGAIFPVYRKEMKGLDWGRLYNQHNQDALNSTLIEDEVKTLMSDEDVTKKKGIYEYILTGQEKHLSIRTFNDRQKREAFERQNGVCPLCDEQFDRVSDMHADHITPWSLGGKTVASNCQMLCQDCNRKKSNK